MLFFGQAFNEPRYSLYQRDREDAAEPLSVSAFLFLHRLHPKFLEQMFWYNPETTGDWWDDLALDNYFTNETDAWAAMRSSWTDSDGVYAAMKAGHLTGHQTHGFLDIGTFVYEALGQRWA